MAKILKAVNVEVPTVGHCYPYYLVSVMIVGNFNYFTGGITLNLIFSTLLVCYFHFIKKFHRDLIINVIESSRKVWLLLLYSIEIEFPNRF